MDSGPRAKPERVGRYWLFRAFAKGGMASIHLGRLIGPVGFTRLVAMKVLHPLCADHEHYTMLLDEARISSRVRHPNVVQTLDVVHDDQRVCIVMEYVHGVDLADAVGGASRLGERIPPNIASSVLVDVLKGLHAAHEARAEDGQSLGLVHRDVSPHNLAIGVDGIARVLDFGIAKVLRKDHVTAEGLVKGKVAYMAPEQLVGGVLTRQSDVYAAGVVLWEALTGKRLFGGVDGENLVARVLGTRILPPSEVAPGIDPALDAVVLRAVASEQRERFATANEMAVALAEAAPPAPSDQVAAWLERVASEDIGARDGLVREAEAFVPEAVPNVAAKSRVRWLSLVAAVGLGVAGAAFAVTRVHRAPSEVTAAPPAPPPPEDTVAVVAPPSTLSIDQPIELSAPAPALRKHTPVRAKRRDCDPPYTIDRDGMKHYKVACLP
jgi:serine/threonine-protein kinase